MQGEDEPPRRFRHLVDRAVERISVGVRGLCEAAHHANELKSRGADFFFARGRLEIEKRADVAAHESLLRCEARSGFVERPYRAPARADILQLLGDSGSLGRQVRRLVGRERKIDTEPDILPLFNVTNCRQGIMEAATSKSYKAIVVARR